MNDTMSPKQRVGAFLTGQPVDRLPCVPLILNHAARILGVPVRDYATDGTTMGRAHVAAFRRYGHDLVTIFTDTAIMAEALGTELYFPEDDVARLAAPAVASPEAADDLGPADAASAGRLPVLLEAVRHCVEEVGDEVFVACCYPAPFSTAAALRGTAMFARDLFKHPEAAHTLLEKSLKLAEDFAEGVAEAGGIPMLVDPVASGSVIGPRVFEQFALPYLQRNLAKIGELGAAPMLHICGRTDGIIELMADTGAIALSVDQIELADAKAKVGDRVCLIGNVRPTETLLEGTPDAVAQEARRCVADCADSPGGFILSSGCEVPIEAPPENVDALLAVAREQAR